MGSSLDGRVKPGHDGWGRVGGPHFRVIVGLDPTIQRRRRVYPRKLDGRVKPGHDG